METDYLRFRRNSSRFTTLKVTLENSALFLDQSKQLVLGGAGTWRIDPIIRIEHLRYGGIMELLIYDGKSHSELISVEYGHKAGDPISIITLVSKLCKFFSEVVLFDFCTWEEYIQSSYYEKDQKGRILEKYK